MLQFILSHAPKISPEDSNGKCRMKLECMPLPCCGGEGGVADTLWPPLNGVARWIWVELSASYELQDIGRCSSIKEQVVSMRVPMRSECSPN